MSGSTGKADKGIGSFGGGARGVSLPICIVAAVVALAVGLLAGRFLLGGTAVSLSGTTTLSEGQLDTTVASYTYNGTTHEITAREVIESKSSLSSAASEDGSYKVPVADDILGYVRNQIVVKEAGDRGLTASEEEVSEYASSMLGTSDIATIAASYSLDEETATKLLTDAAITKKLRDSVVTTTLPEMPTAPTAPADGEGDVATAEYAQYVISLAGDEWDADNDTWAGTEGTYYTALSAYPISNESATYEAAQAAYYVAYSEYSSAAAQLSTEWTSYVNTLLANASIQIGSLAV